MWRREGAHRTDEVSGAWIPKPPAIIDGNQLGDHIAPLAPSLESFPHFEPSGSVRRNRQFDERKKRT
jgi:hypothetical protein